MVLGGSNSMVIAAACHVAPMPDASTASPMLTCTDGARTKLQEREQVQIEQRTRGNSSRKEILGPNTNSNEIAPGTDKATPLEDGAEAALILIRISQSQVRWGVAPMPSSFCERGYAYTEVGHLSFGVEEHHISDPIDGHWYI